MMNEEKFHKEGKNLQFDFTVDQSIHSVFILKEFDAERPLVWDAFTKHEILDQWWAPKPWISRTKRMDFTVGGRRFYAMVSPEGQEHWSIQDYISISPTTNFKYFEAFTDKEENINSTLPSAEWDLNFNEQYARPRDPVGRGTTTVMITVKHNTLADLEQIIQMGFREGITMALTELDNILINLKNNPMKNISLLANGTIVFGVLSILCLLGLHVISTEFKPNFRMVSEYALGKHKWVLTIFFLCWGLCSISSGFMLWHIVTSGWAKFGVLLMFVTGIGAIMGGLFDVQHKLHGLSFGIGVPFLPIGALLISYHLIKKAEWQNHSTALLFSSHSIWISLLLMAVSMFILFSTLKTAGIPFGPDAPPLSELPKGVIGINGWTNRLLVLCYIIYPVLTAKIWLTITPFKN